MHLKQNPLAASRRIVPCALIALVVCLSTATRAEADTSIYVTERSAGIIVHVGAGVGTNTVSLAAGNACIVQGLDGDPDMIVEARGTAQDLAGRVTFLHWDGGTLPYVDNLVNLLVWEQRAGAPDMAEVMRVLAPQGAVYLQQDGRWEKRVKPFPEDIDGWSHFRYDAGSTGMSRDRRVSPPRNMQWQAGPRFMRSHEIETGLSCMVSAGGRIYYILDEGPLGITDARFPAQWSLLCRDAFNGALLWKHPLPDWGWQTWSRTARINDPNTWLGLRTRGPDVDRLMVASEDALYVTLGLGAAVSALDGDSGEIIRSYPETHGALEFLLHRGILLVRLDNPGRIIAVRANDGAVLWRHDAGRCQERSLVASGDRVFYHARNELIALGLDSGEEQWRQETNITPIIVIAGPESVLAVQTAVTLAFCPDTGAPLWQGPGVQRHGRQPDIWVGDNLVWAGAPEFKGLNPRTGTVVRTLDLQSTLESGHHWRCYANKATASFLITALRGTEFLDLNKDEHTRHNWLRGPCISGMMPANGLLYLPPHQCFCYPAVRMDGFFALSGGSEAGPNPPPAGERLVTGAAYDEPLAPVATAPDDWPVYRQNDRRGGAVASAVPAELEQHWEAALGGDLTPAIVVHDRVFLARKDAGTVFCLDLDSGEILWQKTVAGPVDSPPAFHEGRLFFGSRDGRVYCLRAADGELAWQFQAAPVARQVLVNERLESVWPVNGSVLPFKGLIYFSAGRSGFLDGGIHLYALHPDTGAAVHHTVLEGPWPDISLPSFAFHEEGHRADLFTTDGHYLYMGRTVLDQALNEVDAERVNLVGTQRGDKLEYRIMPGMRLVATAGLLDDTFWNRSWWMYTRVWPGFHYAQQAPKSGDLLVFDDAATYTVKHYVTRNRHSPMRFPGDGYLLFADDNDNEPLFYRGEGEPAPMPWEPELPVQTRWNIYLDAAVDKGPGFTRAQPARWTAWVDVRVEAMALADDMLFVAGTPDVLPADDPLAALEGRLGGVLQAIDATNGARLAHYDLPARPVFDGITAARGGLLLAMADGRLVRMAGGKK